jgi:hypothetical protein
VKTILRKLPPLLVAALLLAGVACGPEASRHRGGGAGADPGNRDANVQLHGNQPGDKMMYWDTPEKANVK